MCSPARTAAPHSRRPRTCCPDLIVMDLAMPRVDGWEAIRRLRDSSWTREIPIVAVSAAPDVAAERLRSRLRRVSDEAVRAAGPLVADSRPARPARAQSRRGLIESPVQSAGASLALAGRSAVARDPSRRGRRRDSRERRLAVAAAGRARRAHDHDGPARRPLCGSAPSIRTSRRSASPRTRGARSSASISTCAPGTHAVSIDAPAAGPAIEGHLSAARACQAFSRRDR